MEDGPRLERLVQSIETTQTMNLRWENAKYFLKTQKYFFLDQSNVKIGLLTLSMHGFVNTGRFLTDPALIERSPQGLLIGTVFVCNGFVSTELGAGKVSVRNR